MTVVCDSRLAFIFFISSLEHRNSQVIVVSKTSASSPTNQPGLVEREQDSANVWGLSIFSEFGLQVPGPVFDVSFANSFTLLVFENDRGCFMQSPCAAV